VVLSQIGGMPACTNNASWCSITKGCFCKNPIKSCASLAFKISLKVLVHAGIPPIWDKTTLLTQTATVEKHLQSHQAGGFINIMYGDHPYTWAEDLNAMDKCRYTINACMRMRFCKADSTLEFKGKMNHDTAPKGFKAWFLQNNRKLENTDIFFGHW
jgi:bis(5'-nucleosyl)-tetraphosphatase (symmetrical)